MTVTIIVPPFMTAVAEMESTPGGAEAFARDLRTVTTSVKDVQAEAQVVASPDWQGDTATSHDHAATRFARRVDVSEAALERAVTAAEVFHEALRRLAQERRGLEERRIDLNYDSDLLRSDVDAAVEPTSEQVDEFQRRSRALVGRVEAFHEDVAAWSRRCVHVEEEFIAALAGVDTVSEGRQAATSPDRVDVDALARQLRAKLDDPEALRRWWAALSPAQRQGLVTEHPDEVGNADGLPVADRDEANRTALGRDIDYLAERKADGQLSDHEEDVLANAQHVRDALDEHKDRVDVDTGEQITNVIVYKPGIHSGDGGVAISFGDPDTADHVSVNVPGLTTTTGSTGGNLDKTLALHQAALGKVNGTVASVYWLDYDAPSGNPVNLLDPGGVLDVTQVVGPRVASEGGARFADFLDGLRTSDEGERAHLTAIGHSYGSTTVGYGLRDGADVDDAIILGSPGVPATTAHDLTSADVWVGAKDRDPVSLLGHGYSGGIGTLGNDPTTAAFGATRFDTGDDGGDRVGDLLANHTSYFEGRSVDNMAEIVTDRDDRVESVPRRGEPGGEYAPLSDVLGDAALNTSGDWLKERGEDLGDAVDGLGRGVADYFERRFMP